MKAILIFLVAFTTSLCALSRTGRNIVTPKFSDYPARIYSGQSKIPFYYKKSNGEWRDDMGKRVAPPEINFAGKYYIGLHSCGTGCRYYTLSDLENRHESSALDMFSSGGDRPEKTSDGHVYISSLIARPRSKMLIAQYYIDASAASEEKCRERFFILSDDGKKLTPITGTFNFCDRPG